MQGFLPNGYRQVKKILAQPWEYFLWRGEGGTPHSCRQGESLQQTHNILLSQHLVALISILSVSLHRSFLEKLLLILQLMQVYFFNSPTCSQATRSKTALFSSQSPTRLPATGLHSSATHVSMPLVLLHFIVIQRSHIFCASWMMKLGLYVCIKWLLMPINELTTLTRLH